ncbi:MAG: carboxypeptidase-like regulatory domain-containing protein [Planctomycetota bacterium]
MGKRIAVVALVVAVVLQLGRMARDENRVRTEAPRELGERVEATPTTKRVAPKYRVTGVVRRADGSPFPGAAVGTVTTDAEGRYEFPFEPPKEPFLTLRATAAGHMPATHTLALDAKTTAYTRDFVLVPGGEVTGRIVDEQGRPVPEGFVFARGVTARTEADGRFRLGVATRGGPIHVDAVAPGFRKGQSARPVAPGDDTGDIVLREGLEIAGRMLHPDGTPVVGAQLSVNAQLSLIRGGVRTRTAADGSFRWVGFEPGEYEITCDTAMTGGAFVRIKARAGDRNVRFVVDLWEYRLRFVDADGRPRSGAQPEIVWHVNPGSDLIWPEPMEETEITYLVSKEFRHAILLTKAGRFLPYEAELPKPETGAVRTLEIPLLEPGEPAPLSVRIVGPTEAQARALQVRLLSLFKQQQLAVRTGPGPLPAPRGTWLLDVRAADAGPLEFLRPTTQEVTIRAGRARDVAIEVAAGGRLTFEVDVESSFATGFVMILSDETTNSWQRLFEFRPADKNAAAWQRSVPAGVQLLTRPILAPGHYRLQIDVHGHEKFKQRILIQPMARTHVAVKPARLR